jgi:hypothetical protein
MKRLPVSRHDIRSDVQINLYKTYLTKQYIYVICRRTITSVSPTLYFATIYNTFKIEREIIVLRAYLL